MPDDIDNASNLEQLERDIALMNRNQVCNLLGDATTAITLF